MENIRLPKNFTDKVMRRIEKKEKAAAVRTRVLTLVGCILGGAAVIAAGIMALRHYKIDILSPVSAFLSEISGNIAVHIIIAVFILACISLLYDRHRSRHTLGLSS